MERPLEIGAGTGVRAPVSGHSRSIVWATERRSSSRSSPASGPNWPRARSTEPDDVLRLCDQVVRRETDAQEHPQHPRAEDARECAPADRDRIHVGSAQAMAAPAAREPGSVTQIVIPRSALRTAWISPP